MKKFLFILSLSTLIMGCNNVQSQPKQTPEKVEQKTVITETQNNNKIEESSTTNNKESENLDTSFNMYEKYLDFEKGLIRKYKDMGIRTAYVAPYSKGTDIMFVALNKNMTRTQFVEIAKKTVKEFKQEFGFGKDIKIGVGLDYQKDTTVDTESIYSIDLK